MTVDERARAGLFLAMQYPVEVPGVSVANFLRTAKTAIDGEAPKLRTWVGELRGAMERLHMDPAFAQRNVNEGFSGGEKKRHEIVQLELLKPKIAILDETDSGLDIDALRVVSEGVNRVRATGDDRPAADHPLHPDPALHQAGLRARLRRRPDRRGGRPGAGRAARGRGLRALPGRLRGPEPAGGCIGDAMTASTWRAVRADFPILEPGGQRAPAGLPRLRATPRRSRAQVLDAMREHYERHNANVSRSVHTLGTEATDGVRGRPGQGRRVHRRGVAGRGRVHQELHRGDQPGRVRVLGAAQTRGSGSARATRSSSPRWSTTPTSCRGSCSASAPARRCAGSASPTTAGSTCPTLDELINERTKLVSFVHCSNILGTINAGRRIVARAHAGRRAGAARRLAVGAAPAGRRRRRSAPTSSRSPATRCRPDRHRRAVGPVRAARRDAAVPRRRLDDRDGDDGAARRTRRRRPGSRPARRRSPRRSGSARPSTTCPRSAWTRSPRTSRSITAYALEALATVPGRADLRPGRRRRAAAARSRSRSTGVHPHDVGQVLDAQGVEVRVGPPLRPAGLRRGSACRRRPGRRSTSTPPPTRSTRWCAGWTQVRKVFG